MSIEFQEVAYSGAASGAGVADVAGSDLLPVLVAEDDPETRAVLARLFGKLRIVNPVWFAVDGQQAIDHLDAVAAGSAPVPVLIVLDLNMPRRSGVDVLRWLRLRPALGAVPVVILTGSADVTECHDLGVASFLVKPVGFGALSDVIRGLDVQWALVRPGGADPGWPPSGQYQVAVGSSVSGAAAGL